MLNGGWSLWKVNEETGLCERNCSNPAPQNGGFGCKGHDKIECSKSKIIYCLYGDCDTVITVDISRR